MSYKELILDALAELEVTPESMAEQLAQVIKGQTITKKFNGVGVLQAETVRTDPENAMRGAMIYDALNGGELGIAPRVLDYKRPADIAHRRMIVDNRIIVSADEDGTE
tara:strand:+ start:987 stop:1310 length:324 start_codon:yes stop_codon:yes gene_type:complete